MVGHLVVTPRTRERGRCAGGNLGCEPGTGDGTTSLPLPSSDVIIWLGVSSVCSCHPLVTVTHVASGRVRGTTSSSTALKPVLAKATTIMSASPSTSSPPRRASTRSCGARSTRAQGADCPNATRRPRRRPAVWRAGSCRHAAWRCAPTAAPIAPAPTTAITDMLLLGPTTTGPNSAAYRLSTDPTVSSLQWRPPGLSSPLTPAEHLDLGRASNGEGCEAHHRTEAGQASRVGSEAPSRARQRRIRSAATLLWRPEAPNRLLDASLPRRSPPGSMPCPGSGLGRVL